MIKLFFIIYAVALSACGSDRYNDNKIVPIDIPLSPELSGLTADQLVAKIKEKE